LIEITIRLAKPPTQPDDFREMHLLVGGFGQLFGFIEVRPSLFKLVCAQLIFGELRQIAR
jgi:hypothetical protein